MGMQVYSEGLAEKIFH